MAVNECSLAVTAHTFPTHPAVNRATWLQTKTAQCPLGVERERDLYYSVVTGTRYGTKTPPV